MILLTPWTTNVNMQARFARPCTATFNLTYSCRYDRSLRSTDQHIYYYLVIHELCCILPLLLLIQILRLAYLIIEVSGAIQHVRRLASLSERIH